MQVIANDTLRCFALGLNAKACYALTLQKRVLTAFRNNLKTRHRVITYKNRAHWMSSFIIENSLPSGDHIQTSFFEDSTYYVEMTSEDVYHGLYEAWDRNGILTSRAFYWNDRREGVSIIYDVHDIKIYHRCNYITYIVSLPPGGEFPSRIKKAQEMYENLLKL